ncbi:MAG TPA: carboxypeptidase-like regulatory domain-containing protein [Mucilaginibacter sp.]|jgi:hypothetical protein|nr:carboxypeptidase-like regulatory domain-containing protein [Mucilaginibacter sp.]
MSRVFKAFILVLIACFLSNSLTWASAQQINIKVINAPIELVFNDIQKQTDYKFVYTREVLDKANRVTADIKNSNLDNALKLIFLNEPLSYTMYNKMVIVKEKPAIDHDITGTVTDAKMQPVAGATVFLTNTKKATSTDASGKFILNKLSPGNYELVVNMIGFEVYRQSIKIQDAPFKLSIVLKESNTMLNTVEIKVNNANPKKDAAFLKLFINNFIGFDANAAQCKLLNPEVLNFTMDRGRGILQATADDFLLIENNALGYRLKYLLKGFRFYYMYGVCYYDGNPYFEELNGTEQQRKKWEANRKLAYLGSYQNFFRAAMNNTLQAESFYVYELWPKKSRLRFGGRKLIKFDTLMVAVDKNFKALITKPVVSGSDTIRRTFHVVYTEHKPNRQTQLVQLADTILIGKNGALNPGMGFSIEGQWARQRIADLTPLDYFVDPYEKKK